MAELSPIARRLSIPPAVSSALSAANGAGQGHEIIIAASRPCFDHFSLSNVVLSTVEYPLQSLLVLSCLALSCLVLTYLALFHPVLLRFFFVSVSQYLALSRLVSPISSSFCLALSRSVSPHLTPSYPIFSRRVTFQPGHMVTISGAFGYRAAPVSYCIVLLCGVRRRLGNGLLP